MSDINDLNSAMEALEAEARKDRLLAESSDLIEKAKTHLIFSSKPNHRFFASLACQDVKEYTPDWNVGTAATDGKSIRYNPAWVATLTTRQVIGLIVHEVMHISNRHHLRRAGRDMAKWNIACDKSINDLIVESGLELPAKGIFPESGEAKGLSAEDYYNDDKQDRGDQDDQDGEGDGQGQSSDQGDQEQDGDGDEQGQGQGNPSPDPGGCGGIVDAPAQSEQEIAQEEARVMGAIARAAQAARACGTMSAGLERIVNDILFPRPDLADVVQQFFNSKIQSDRTFARPNRRYSHMGIMLPGRRKQTTGTVIVAIDASGSISQDQITEMMDLIGGCLELHNVRLKIAVHDVDVQSVMEWQPSDGPLSVSVKGGGGTSHIPVFQWADEVSEQEEPPSCMVCLTDMASEFPDDEPGFPVLFVGINSTATSSPFGEYVEFPREGLK